MVEQTTINTRHQEGIGRFYDTPNGSFPSVTTVLGAYGDSSWLDEWRKNIGEDKADAIVKEASDIGTHMHYLFECLLQDEKPTEPETPEQKKALAMFNSAKTKLLKMIDKVLYMEEAVWSKEFRIAGRFDLLFRDKEGKVILLDYKNTRRTKSREDIDSYRLQIAFYVKMIEETLGIKVDECKIFMVNREGFVQIFKFKNEETKRSELVAIRKNFWDKFGY